MAAALGVSGPAVESLLFKGRRRLQERLRTLRAASSALVLPVVLRDGLEAAIPGFASGASSGAGAAAGGAVIAKIAGAPTAAKLAAVAVAVGSGTALTVAGRQGRPPAPEPPSLSQPIDGAAEAEFPPASARAARPAVTGPQVRPRAERAKRAGTKRGGQERVDRVKAARRNERQVVAVRGRADDDRERDEPDEDTDDVSQDTGGDED